MTAYVVDKLFPFKQLHLIYGPTGVGKTIFSLQLLDEWAHGREFLGYKSFPAQFVYLACMVTADSIREQMDDLGMEPSEFPVLSLLDATSHQDHTFSEAFTLAKHAIPAMRVLFLDGIAGLCEGNIAIHREAKKFLGHIVQVAREQNIAVFGTMSCSKTNGAESSGLERIFGSIACSESAYTKIFIDYANPRVSGDADRTLTVYSRRFPSYDLNMSFCEGRLVQTVIDPQGIYALHAWLIKQEPDASLTRADILAIAVSLKITERTAERWIADCVKLGSLLRVGRGEYRTPKASLPS